MTQYDVFAAVRQRGYLNNWTPEQLAARQIAKLAEELAELADAVGGLNHMDGDWLTALRTAGALARRAFDDHERWQTVICDPLVVDAELPDVMVPALVLAQIVGLDLMNAARAKAIADRARGVRNGATASEG